MGKNNKARRNAKARAKARRPHGGTPGGSPRGSRRARAGWGDDPADGDHADIGFSPAERANALLHMIVNPDQRGDDFAERGRAALRDMHPPLVQREAEGIFDRLVGSLWDNGWQPAELARQARRGCARSPGARAIVAAISADHARRRPDTIDPRWAAQLENLALPAVGRRPGWLRTWLEADVPDWDNAIDAIVDGLTNLYSLPPLDELLPPPGAGTDRSRASASASARPAAPSAGDTDPVLERIRALLAKAESTDFEAESLAFTAKAQELMTRHAIDLAMVERLSADEADAPVAVRVPVDAPYADAKSWLLQVVAKASRCRSVFHSRLDLSTIVGFPTDVSAVELMFTSLLVQAQTAMAEAAANAPAGTRTRSQSYRSAFLLSYTDRIADRLAEINRSVMAEAETTHGRSLLPVLASREDRVDQAVDERFGETIVESRVRSGFDLAGQVSGRLAADRAQLNFGDLDDRSGTDPESPAKQLPLLAPNPNG